MNQKTCREFFPLVLIFRKVIRSQTRLLLRLRIYVLQPFPPSQTHRYWQPTHWEHSLWISTQQTSRCLGFSLGEQCAGSSTPKGGHILSPASLSLLLTVESESLPSGKPSPFPRRPIGGDPTPVSLAWFSLQSPCYAAVCLSDYSVKSFLNKCLTLSNLSQCLSVGFLMHSVIPTSVFQNSWSPGVWPNTWHVLNCFGKDKICTRGDQINLV